MFVLLPRSALIHLNPIHSIPIIFPGPKSRCLSEGWAGQEPLGVPTQLTHNWECAANPASHGLIGPLTDWGWPPPPARVPSAERRAPRLALDRTGRCSCRAIPR